MKYFVLVALLGNAAAKHHHHAHGLAQLSAPEDSRNAWQTTRDASLGVVAEQVRFQAAHNAMVAKNFADDTEATDAKKNYVRNAYIRTTIGAPRPPASTYPPTVFAQVSDPLGKANESFKVGKSEAAGVVKSQEDFQATHNDMVKSNFDGDTTETDAKKNAVRKAYGRTLSGSNSFAQLEEEKDDDKKDFKNSKYGKADDARQSGTKAANKIIAKQESTETKVTDGVEKRFKDDTEETDEKKQDIQKNLDKKMKEYNNNMNEAFAGPKKAKKDVAEELEDKDEKKPAKKASKKEGKGFGIGKKEKAEEEVTTVYIPEQDIFVSYETEKLHVLEPPAEHQFAEQNWGIHKGGRGARTSFY